jgi:hypothetical protein
MKMNFTDEGLIFLYNNQITLFQPGSVQSHPLIHGPVQQIFNSAPSGWWVTEDWHIAHWKSIVSPPGLVYWPE